MVFCEFPIAKWHVHRDKFSKVMAVLCIWAAAAMASQTPFIMCGLAGTKWQDPTLHRCIQEGTLEIRHHHMCAMNIQVDETSTTPTSCTMVTASNTTMPEYRCS